MVVGVLDLQPVSSRFFWSIPAIASVISGECRVPEHGWHWAGLGLSSEPRIPTGLCCVQASSCVLQTLLSCPREAFCRYSLRLPLPSLLKDLWVMRVKRRLEEMPLEITRQKLWVNIH